MGCFGILGVRDRVEGLAGSKDTDAEVFAVQGCAV